MVEIFGNVLGTIGNTPLIRLNRVTEGLKATVLAKVESFNPGGSVKDRIGIAMIEDAERRGLLKPGGTIVEPTSGNTGVGLAMVAAIKGYRIVFTIPDKMSKEKINMLKAYGARVVITPTAVPPDSPESYYSVAQRIADETPNSFMPSQYFNPKNPEAHYLTTGPELWRQTDGRITHFVCGIGTGGTISGVGKYLKERNKKIKIIGVDPVGSILREYFYTKQKAKAHTYRVEGIGEDIIPGTTHFQYIDEIYSVTDKESFLMTRRLAREEGLLMGGSSGSAVVVALRVAEALEEDKVVVVMLPDTGERYLSKVHSEEWLRENGYLEIEMSPIETILSAKEDAIPEVVSVDVRAPLVSAIGLMRRYGISQMPVLRDGKPIGSITEAALLERLSSEEKIEELRVEDAMGEGFPIVERGTDLRTILQLLERGNPAVLVETDGKIEGIISRMDIIEYLAERGD
ncbi:MAG: cystathionine beta-synthase [Candidatus Thermoplasmatota archaeon]